MDRVEESEKKVGDGDNNGYDGISGSKGLPSETPSEPKPPKAPAKDAPMLPPSDIPKKRRKPEAASAEVSTASVEMLAEEAQT